MITRSVILISFSVLSVGAAAAGIVTADICTVTTDRPLLVDNWQPLPAAKQQTTDMLTCCWHCLFTF